MTDDAAYHLAEFNVGTLLEPLDAPGMAGFVALLDPVNALADAAPGFVWRLVGADPDNATDIQVEGRDLIFNMSVWESRAALWDFVYRTAHLDYLRRRREWFVHVAQPIHVMWWVPAGAIPDLEDGLRRLDLLRERGAGPEAFTFRDFYDPPAPDDQAEPVKAGR